MQTFHTFTASNQLAGINRLTYQAIGTCGAYQRSAEHMKSDNLHFRIEIGEDDNLVLEETLSANTNFIIAKAAFEKAVAIHPKARILLRDKARVILEKEPD